MLAQATLHNPDFIPCLSSYISSAPRAAIASPPALMDRVEPAQESGLAETWLHPHRYHLPGLQEEPTPPLQLRSPLEGLPPHLLSLQSPQLSSAHQPPLSEYVAVPLPGHRVTEMVTLGACCLRKHRRSIRNINTGDEI